MSVRVRLANEADLASVRTLVDELLVDAPIDHARRFAWLYHDAPRGVAHTWLAEDEASGEVIGCTSFFRRAMCYRGRELSGALGGDGYVRPAFRRKGVGQSLHAASQRDMGQLGIDVMFGTPMPANMTPLRSIGAVDVTFVSRHVRPLDLRRLGIGNRMVNHLAKRVMAPRTSARLEAAVPNDERIDYVWSRVKNDIGLATVRDSKFYAWRFNYAPTQKQHPFVVMRNGEPIGVCALERTNDETMRIVDLFAEPAHVTPSIFAIAEMAVGCSQLEMRLTVEQARARSLWKSGFLEREASKPLNVVLPKGSPNTEVFWEPSHWWVTWLDTDLDVSLH